MFICVATQEREQGQAGFTGHINGQRRRSQHRLLETNMLVPLHSVAEVINTPTYKGVFVRLEPAAQTCDCGVRYGIGPAINTGRGTTLDGGDGRR